MNLVVKELEHSYTAIPGAKNIKCIYQHLAAAEEVLKLAWHGWRSSGVLDLVVKRSQAQLVI